VQALLEESDSDNSEDDMGIYGGAVDAELEKFKMKTGISKYSSQVTTGIAFPITEADFKIEVPKSQSQYAF